MRLRALVGDTQVFDRGSEHWRGGVVVDVGATVTIRFLAEQTLPKTATVDGSVVPAGLAKGHPVCVKVTGVEANAHAVTEVRASHWIDAPRPDEAEWVDRASVGLVPWFYGAVPKSITRAPEEHAWTGGR